jgi:carboxyl-terminal processing protease
LSRATPRAFLPHSTRSLLGGLALLVSLLTAQLGQAADDRLLQCRQKGADSEKRGNWLDACRWYDEALRKDRNHPETRTAYLRCLRRVQIAARYRDSAYTDAVSRLTPTQAFDIYKHLLGVVASAYVDRARTTPAVLFKQGLQELRFALEDPGFRKKYLDGVSPDAIKAFQTRLKGWHASRVGSATDACDQLMSVVAAAREDGVWNGPAFTPVICLEFAAGACNTLDEYSGLITPGHQGLVQVALKGKQVGVGVELAAYDDHSVQVSRVFPKGPAAEAGLLCEDRIVRIDDEMPDPDTVADKLRGEVGSTVVVEITRDSHPRPLKFQMVRRAVALPSTEAERIELPMGDGMTVSVGYLRINHFQDSTPQEVKEALASWNLASPASGVKGVILDLRGNPGGLFKPAVNVAELFLSDGTVVISHSAFKEFNRPFRVESAGPVQLPVVVLIDGETASSAEVLAGALKEGRRFPTRLLGQTTYGKGSVQCLVGLDRPPLDKLPGSVRLTVAKLFSPTNQPYTGRGVEPHEPLSPNVDPLTEAKEQLKGLLRAAGMNPLTGDVPVVPPA